MQRLRAHEFAVDVVHSEAAALDKLRIGDPDVSRMSVGTDGPGAAILDRVRQAAQVGVVAITDADFMPLLSTVTRTSARDFDALGVRIRNVLRNFRFDTESLWDGGEPPREIGELEVDVASRRVYLLVTP